MAYPIKSKEDKETQGTDRKDRLSPEFIQPDPMDQLPWAPGILGKAGKKYWKKYTKLLQSQAMLVETDLDLLAQFCMHLQIAESAAEKLNESLTEVLPNQLEVKSKYLTIFNDASDRANKLGKEFGFSPLSRKGIPSPKKPKEGKLMKLIRNKNA